MYYEKYFSVWLIRSNCHIDIGFLATLYCSIVIFYNKKRFIQGSAQKLSIHGFPRTFCFKLMQSRHKWMNVIMSLKQVSTKKYPVGKIYPEGSSPTLSDNQRTLKFRDPQTHGDHAMVHINRFYLRRW